MEKYIEIGGRLHSTATGNVTTGANEILDDELNKKQSQINSETLQHVESIDAALQELSPDQTQALALATDVNTLKAKSVRGDETQSLTDAEKEQAISNMGVTGVYDISSEHPVSGHPKKYSTLPAALADVPVGRRKSGMSVKALMQLTQEMYHVEVTEGVTDLPTGYDEYELSEASSMTTGDYTYNGLDTENFSAIPSTVGASVLYYIYDSQSSSYTTWLLTKSSDSTYAYKQYLYMQEYANTTAGNTAFLSASNWQGVDDKPTAGSNNLIKSGGVYNQINQINKKIDSGMGIAQPLETVNGKYISRFDGTIVDNSSYSYSIFSVNENDCLLFTINGNVGSAVATVSFWDSNDTNITTLNRHVLGELFIIIPSNVVKVIISYLTNPGLGIVRKTKNPMGLPINSVSTENIKNKAVTIEKLWNTSAYDNVLQTIRTNNLFDIFTMIVEGFYITNSGDISPNSESSIAKIPVVAGETYFASASLWGRLTGFIWQDLNGIKISGYGQSNIEGQHIAPEGAAYFVCNYKFNGGDTTNNLMFSKSSTAIPYEPYRKINVESVKGFEGFNTQHTFEWITSAISGRLFNVSGQSNKFQVQKPSTGHNSFYLYSNDSDKDVKVKLTASSTITMGVGLASSVSAVVNDAIIDKLNELSYNIDNIFTVPAGQCLVFYFYDSSSNTTITTKQIITTSNRISDVENEVEVLSEKVVEISEEIAEIKGDFDLKFTIDGNEIKVSKDSLNYITSQRIISRNGNYNFKKICRNGIEYDATDDITPMHILNTTLGGNHAQPISKATITNHGLTNADVGTAWLHNNGKTYYIVKIVDSDNINFLSENRGTLVSPIFDSLITGTITKDAITKTIESVESNQMYPGIKNETLKILVDNKEVSSDGDYYGNIIDFVESYDIMNPASILNNLVLNVGNTEPPIYDGDVAVHVDITYRYLKGLNRLVFTTYRVIQDSGVSFDNFMFTQKTGMLSAKYYTPNCTLFKTPRVFDLSSSGYINTSNRIKSNLSCNRVLQYKADSNEGFATGVLGDYGVGKNLVNYTSEFFELRGNTAKIYPHLVDSSILGNTLNQNSMYSAVMYYILFDYDYLMTSNRISMYHFTCNGVEYVYVDYSGSMIDKVSIDDSLNGKTVEVLESSNTSLMDMIGNTTPNEVNNIYNGGFYVNANYVENETCYIVVKIS